MNVPKNSDPKYFVYAETLLNKRKSVDKNRFFKQLKRSQIDETDNRLFPTNSWSVKASQLKLMVKSSFMKIFWLAMHFDSCVKEAAEKSNTEKMLTDITWKDLIARVFKIHQPARQYPYFMQYYRGRRNSI